MQLEVERELQDDIGAGYPCAMATDTGIGPQSSGSAVLGGGQVEKRKTIRKRQVV